MTSGKKLSDAVKRICKVLKECGDGTSTHKAAAAPPTLAGRLKRKAGEALRRQSSDPLPEPKVPAMSSSSQKKQSLEDELRELKASYGLQQASHFVMEIQAAKKDLLLRLLSLLSLLRLQITFSTSHHLK